MEKKGFDTSDRELVQKKKVGLFNRKLKKEAKKFDKKTDSVIDDSASLKVNCAKAKTLAEMCKEDSHKYALTKIIDMLEYAAPSSAKGIEKADEKISNKLDDIKVLIAGAKSPEKIADKIEELRVAVADRNNMCNTGVM